MKKRAKKGFTLIELLVVIFIIGLLASVVVVNVNAARMKARDAKRKSDIASVQTAIEAYADERAEYPDTVSVWKESATNTIDWVPNITPLFISVLPLDPKNVLNTPGATRFVYYYRSDKTDYKLMVWNMESATGREWAANDGGPTTTPLTAPGFTGGRNCTTSGGWDSVTACNYEIFSGGAQPW
ncbi:MAG: General secretion pathway protein G [Berkelbacteria bacterium GW2011_GWB1_38_5]|uniref:General secretion pathway protein G n=1 Tax=Berkelbacteria bacterium GW2011_GWB1_38_5 TaxID=1618336 RepID=A0A0G0K6L9_9BACT|nr:MAG: General secretion pathway protein G [Berkelbacteria bacterium GW2011_GWB1_38_5]